MPWQLVSEVTSMRTWTVGLSGSTREYVLTAHSGQLLKSPNCQGSKYDRLRHMYPKPILSPTLGDQLTRSIMRPYHGEECQIADHVGQNGRKRGVGEIRRRAKRDAHKKVHQKLWPQDAMSEVRQRKSEGGNDDRDRTVKLPFEGHLKYPRNPASSMKGATREPIKIMRATVMRG